MPNHSPRISFSQDFPEFDSIPVEKSRTRSPSGFSFDLPLPIDVLTGESSWSAEEIFSDGKLLPTGIKKSPDPRDLKPRKLPVQKIPGLSKQELDQLRGVDPVHEIEEIKEVELMANTRHRGDGVWFDRPDSLDCDVALPLLKQTKLRVSSASSSSSSSNCFFQKNKSYGVYRYKGNGGGIKVNSLLDMIPSGTLFGLGSIMVGSGSNNTKNKKSTMIFTW